MINNILPITIFAGCALGTILLVAAAKVNWRRIDSTRRLVGVLAILSLLCLSAALLADILDSPVVSNVFHVCFAVLIMSAGLFSMFLRRKQG